jgi:hypothetical protein
MIAYATHAEFEQTNVIVGFIPEGVGAFATPVRNRMVLPIDLEKELQALIQHELTHIFQYEIFFGGRRGRAIYARPPLWFMEGMASYYGDDEDSRDEMYMRDAALSDQLPPILRAPQGFLAYRYGHKVFEYIEEEWGEDVVRDFVFSFRGNFGGQVERPLAKVFNFEPEEFDAAFRTWMRRKYEHAMDRGLPTEFGRKFKVPGFLDSNQTSPDISPSGDLVAAFTTYKQDVDVAIFGLPDRQLYKNLTKGLTTKYQYLVAQGLTTRRRRAGISRSHPTATTWRCSPAPSARGRCCSSTCARAALPGSTTSSCRWTRPRNPPTHPTGAPSPSGRCPAGCSTSFCSTSRPASVEFDQ